MRLVTSPTAFAVGARLLLPVLVLLAGACGETTPSATPGADLQATASGSGTAAVGDDVTYTVRVHNGGPDAAQQVVIQSDIAGAYDVVSIGDGGAQSGNMVTWPVLASLANQAEVEHAVTIRPTAEGDVTIRVSATAASEDPNAANNNGSAGNSVVTTQVSRQADLQLTVALPAAADGVTEAVFTLTVTNRGPSAATDVVVSDTLWDGVEVVVVSDAGTATGKVVTWPTVGSLANGATLVYAVTVVIPPVGPAPSVHVVEASSTDPLLANNRVIRRTVVTATPFRTIQGLIVGEQFGWEIEPVGDIDGDGAADLAVSAPFGNGSGPASGRVYVYSGGSGAEIRRFDGVAGDWHGIDMDASTDFTGDGIPELIVGAPTADGVNAPGRVYVYSLVDGSTVRVLTGESAGDRFGWSAAGAGDVNNDGTPDLYVGARDRTTPTGTGRGYVYSGLDWSLLLTVDGSGAGGMFGQAGGGVGDLNNDGFDDLAIGAPSEGSGRSGRVYVISGATGQSLFPPISADGTGVNFGSFWIFSPGDMNGDGVPDVYASDINNNALGGSTGRAYIYSGVDGSPILTLTGEAAGDQYGIGHPVGDLDGDGVTDLNIAAWLNGEGGNQAGKIYLVSGASGASFRTITSTVAGENFGFDTFVIGDVTGDGVPDLAVSGGISGTTAGHVKLFAGVVP